MKLTPHAQKLADDWLDKDYGDLNELVEILGLSRGGIGAEVEGHCYQLIRDENFSASMIEDVIDDEARLLQLTEGGAKPTSEELEAWREAERNSQPATQFYVWRVPFSREDLFISTVHRKNGFVDKVDGPFHSVDASIPYGDVVFDR